MAAVRDTSRSWDYSRNEVCARPSRRSGGLCPTVNWAANDRCGVFGVIEPPGCHELREGPFGVEATHLGIPESNEKWPVGGTWTNLLETKGLSPERSSRSSQRCC